jgi:hypothetical protein
MKREQYFYALKRANLQRFKSRLCTILIGCLLFPYYLQAQHKIVQFGNKILDFNNSNSIQLLNLPTPSPQLGEAGLVYTGATPTRSQYAEYDDQGQLLFFMVDGKIYNRDGYLLVANTPGTQYYQYYDEDGLDYQIIKVPGHCDKFYIIKDRCKVLNTDTGVASLDQDLLFDVYVLDMSLQNHFFPNHPDRKGRLVNVINPPAGYPVNFTAIALQSLPSANSLGTSINDYPIYSSGDLALVPNSARAISITIPNLSFSGGQPPVNNSYKTQMRSFVNSTTGNVVLISIKYFSTALWDVRSDGVFFNSTSACNVHYNDYPRFYDAPNLGWLNNEIVIYNGNESTGYSQIGKYNSSNLNQTNCYTGPSAAISSSEISQNNQYVYVIQGGLQTSQVTLSYLNLASASPVPTTLFSFNSGSLGYSLKDAYTFQNNYQGVPSIFYVLPNRIDVLKGANNPLTAQYITNVVSGFSNPQMNLSFVAPLGVSNFTGHSFVAVTTPQVYNRHLLEGAGAVSSACCVFEQDDVAVGNYTFTGSGIWNYGSTSNPWGATSPVYVTGTITVETGASLTISAMTFKFAPTGSIVVKRGGKLKVFNSTLTSYDCQKVMWKGVDVLGLTNAANSIEQTTTVGGNQGILELQNARIENALVAVEVGTNTTNGGGYVKAVNSRFTNNVFDAVFKKFRYVPSTGVIAQNKSVFENCNFETTAALNDPALFPKEHISLTQIDKLRIRLCNFYNTTNTSTHPWNQRGIGINSYMSSFICDGNNIDNRFEKLNIGINSLGLSLTSTFVCSKMNFDFCRTGINNTATDNIQVYLNDFKIPEIAGADIVDQMEKGIYCTTSTAYLMEQNTFEGVNDPAVNDEFPSGLGIWIDNSGDAANEIRNNDFISNRMGIYCTSYNGPIDISNPTQTGLQLLCNTFSNTITDVFRDQNSSLRYDQGGNQQDPFTSIITAGNRFSQSTPDCSILGDFVIDPNNSQYNNYFSNTDANTIPDCGGQNTSIGDLLIVWQSNGSWTNEQCPQSYSSSGVPLGIMSSVNGSYLNNRNIEFREALNHYKNTIDKNQTANTLNYLSHVYPDESNLIQALLMERYPLSDEVLKKIIIEAEKMDSWHLTEVILANCPLKKEVLSDLEKSEVLSEFFMSFIYEAQESGGTGLKRFLEIGLTNKATQYQEDLNLLISQSNMKFDLDSDSILYSLKPSDYISAVQTNSELENQLTKAYYELEFGSLNEGLSILSDLESLSLIAPFIQLNCDIAHQLQNDNSSFIRDSLFTQLSGKPDNIINLAIQFQMGLEVSWPDPRLPIQYRSLSSPPTKERKKLELLGVWPNPVQNNAYVHYPIEADGKGVLHLTNMIGQQVRTYNLNSNGLLEMDTTDLESGVYIIGLYVNDRILETIKFTKL